MSAPTVVAYSWREASRLLRHRGLELLAGPVADSRPGLRDVLLKAVAVTVKLEAVADDIAEAK